MRSLLLLALLLVAGCGTTRISESRSAKSTIALERVAAFRHLGFQVVTARLKLGVDTALAYSQLDTLLSAPTGDIFWMYPAAGFYFNCREQIGAAWRDRFREAFKVYTPYRGDTENHFLMYYSTLYLFSQEWPDLAGSEWFNGKSSREIHAEAKEFLDHWIDETARLGMTEWDSPRYLYYYMAPLILLRDFATDPVMKKRAEMSVELQLADYASEYLNGSYGGAHSRDGDGSVIDPRRAEATSYGQFYFEDSLSFVLPDLAYAALSSFTLPPVIRAIAHDRDRSWVHTETKRSRAKMRFLDGGERFETVRKYNYITPDFILGSIQGGLQQPIQQHSWDITFSSQRANNTLFGLHPQSSALELGMFFPEEPELMEEGVISSKGSYGSPDKWIGGSPFESIVQQEGGLMARYDIPSGWRFPHVDLYLPKTLDTIIRDPSGWIFCRMENALVGIRTLSPPEWIEQPNNWRVRLNSPQTGYVVETATAREIDFESFRNALRPHAPTTGPSGTIVYTTRSGKVLRLAPTSRVPVAESDEMLFDGRHIRSRRGSGIIELSAMGEVRTLDFTRSATR